LLQEIVAPRNLVISELLQIISVAADPLRRNHIVLIAS
jgi:hypothetical protein